jgi:hypothetical protein
MYIYIYTYIQASSTISLREATITDNLERINISTNLKSLFHIQKTENTTENVKNVKNVKNLKDLSENCDFYNHRGYILQLKNEEKNGFYVIWEFHLPSIEIRNSW